MCVICIVKGGQPLPSREIMRAMYRANPHGMGFVSPSVSYKGMDFSRFYNKLVTVPKGENIIIHFRYATHGSVCAKNCHPFKKGTLWFAHNGILDITPEGDMTDSETAFRNHLYPVAREYGIFSDELAYTVEEIRGTSRFAFMDGDGNVKTFGHFEDYQGMLCSNLNWQRYIYQKPIFSRAWYSCLP